MDNRVAAVYARALFSFANKENSLAVVEEDLTGIVTAIRENRKLNSFFFSRKVSRDDKAKLLVGVFAGRVSPQALNIVRLLLQKRRETLVDQVLAEFVRLRREHDRVLAVVISSARPLTDEHERAIVTKLQTATGRRVEATYSVEPDLLGGVKVSSENYVLDGTVVGTLARLREHMIYDLLKQNA